MRIQGIEPTGAATQSRGFCFTYAANMASQWKTLQRFAENLVFNEAPKFIRQLQRPENLPRGIQQGIKIGLDVLTGTADDSPTAITAGRPVTKNSVPTAQRARKLVYAPDLDGRADPGEMVWTWVVYEDDPSRGKDRPVLVVGRDRRTLLGLMLSSQERHQTIATGSASVRALGITRHARAGCGWTGCWTCPRRAFAAKARSWSARPSRSSRRGCAPTTRGAELPRSPPHRPHLRSVWNLDFADLVEAEPAVVRDQFFPARFQVGGGALAIAAIQAGSHQRLAEARAPDRRVAADDHEVPVR